MSIRDNLNELVTQLENGDARIPGNDDGGQVTRLSVLVGPGEGRSVVVAGDCVIGRSPDAQVRLADPGVSRKHVRIWRAPDGQVSLEDMSSRNGTLVNGQRVSRCTLESGDRIQVGPHCVLLLSVHDALEEALINANKLEIIGRFSAGINHDFNNLLCVILANAAYLLELPPELPLGNAEVRECLDDLRSAAQSGAELTTRLATLAQSNNLVQERVSFSELCAETLGVLRDTCPKSIRIQGYVQPNVFVRGVRAHLRQLVLNPCLNARDALSEGGKLTFEAVVEELHELSSVPPLKADCYVVVTVTDTGCGMAPEVLKSAFEPFFTTKEIDLGRGLGLAIVRKVAADHGGTVELTSQRGAGTTLRIVLPVVDCGSAVEPNRGEAGPSGEPGGRADPAPRPDRRTSDEIVRPREAASVRRVLLAEADEALGRAITRSLRRAGYEVTWVADTTRAADELAQTPDYFDLVLLDPPTGEPQAEHARQRIRRLRSDLPAVVLTEKANNHEGTFAEAHADIDTMVQKPVDPAVLARVVQVALRQAGRGSHP